jgi:hypothetical protein
MPVKKTVPSPLLPAPTVAPQRCESSGGTGDSSPRKWIYARRQPGRPRVLREIRLLVVRMASENPGWGYTRIQGALKNLGHHVARSTIAAV